MMMYMTIMRMLKTMIMKNRLNQEDDGDDFIHPKLTTHDDEIIHEEETDEDDSFDPTVHTPSQISSLDDEDSENEIKGTKVEGAKSDEDATFEEDQGNEAVKDTNTNLDGRDDVMTDVLLPQVQATQEIEDTHVTLTPVNPDGQQQSLSVSSGFVSNMLNPKSRYRHHLLCTNQSSSNTESYRHSNTIKHTILDTATTKQALLRYKSNLPDFALSTIPGIVDQYLANKMQEAVDIAVQLKYDKIQEESHTENQ
ncbi:hypothetical protein Tco_1296629 [Tanacetum coccineum]